jgi:hypothetical protein
VVEVREISNVHKIMVARSFEKWPLGKMQREIVG